MKGGCPTVVRTDDLPRCPTYSDYVSTTCLQSRTTDQPIQQEFVQGDMGNRKVCDIGCPTPQNPLFSVPFQYDDRRPSLGRSTPFVGPQHGNLIPCPAIVFEASAAISEGNRLDHPQSDLTAISTFGFASWDALASAHAERIKAALDQIPAPCDAIGKRLLDLTRWFLGTASWVAAIENGWPLSDVFGVAEWTPQQRRDVLGLVPTLALSPKRGRKIEAVSAIDATLRDPDGRSITFRRPSLNAADLTEVVSWWESPVLINREAA